MIMNYYLPNVLITDFCKGLQPISIANGLFLLVLKYDLQNLHEWKRTNIFGYYYHCINYLTKSLNYVPEIRNGCNLWEQVFRRYWVDTLVFDRWGNT